MNTEPGPAHAGEGVDLARAALVAARRRATARRVEPVAGRRGPAREDTRSDRDPRPVAAALEDLVSARGWTVPVAEISAVDRWVEVVGPDIAGRTTAQSLVDGVLTVRAATTAWATQLRLMAPQILHRLNTELGHGTVTRIAVKGPDTPSWSRGPLRVRDGRGPRDTYG